MEKYLGVKLVQAEVYNNELKGEGYKVIYEDGYESWSPKDVFEKAYRKYEPFYDKIRCDGENQEYMMRVIIEAEQLQSKIDKLEVFIKDNPNFVLCSSEEQTRLIQQILAMKYYVTILSERINNF